MIEMIFFTCLGIFLGLVAAPYTGIDEKIQNSITSKVIARLKEEGLVKEDTAQ